MKGAAHREHEAGTQDAQGSSALEGQVSLMA